MYQTVLRDGLGRWTGSLDNFHTFGEDDNYIDYKIDVENVRFPSHNYNKVYPVRRYHISELNKYKQTKR